MLFMPASPVYLLSSGDAVGAERSLRWLRGPQHDVAAELEAMKKSLREQSRRGSVGLGQLLFQPKYLGPFLVVLGLMFFQQFSGVNSVVFYVQTIFKMAGSDMEPGDQSVHGSGASTTRQ